MVKLLLSGMRNTRFPAFCETTTPPPSNWQALNSILSQQRRWPELDPSCLVMCYWVWFLAHKRLVEDLYIYWTCQLASYVFGRVSGQSTPSSVYCMYGFPKARRLSPLLAPNYCSSNTTRITTTLQEHLNNAQPCRVSMNR